MEAEEEGKVGKFWICFEGTASGRFPDRLDVVGETESRSRVIPRILACTLGKIGLPTEGVMQKGSLGMGWEHRVWGGRQGLASDGSGGVVCTQGNLSGGGGGGQ